MNTRDWLFFDYDDTLGGVLLGDQVVPGNRAYADVLRRFADAMEERGFDREESLATQQTVDQAACVVLGFSDKTRFPSSLRDTYYQMSTTHGRNANPETGKLMYDIGMSVFTDYPYTALPGALEVLERLKPHYNIAVVTKGETVEQWRKLYESGVAPLADHVFVQGHKNDREWEEIFTSLGFIQPIPADPRTVNAWAIGNSAKADVNPPVRLGLNGIHIVDPQEWVYEVEEYAPVQGGRRLEKVTAIGEVLSIVPH